MADVYNELVVAHQKVFIPARMAYFKTKYSLQHIKWFRGILSVYLKSIWN